MTNFDRVTAFDNLDIYCIVQIDDIYTYTDGFHGTCSLIPKAYQRPLADVDHQTCFGGFSLSTELWINFMSR